MSYQVRLQQGVTIVDLDKVQASPIRSGSLVAEHESPGGSPKLQWMGQRAKNLELRGLLLGSGAKATVDDINSLQSSQNTVQVTLQAHGVTWLNQVDHIITGFSYELEPGTPDAAETVKVRYYIALRRKT